MDLFCPRHGLDYQFLCKECRDLERFIYGILPEYDKKTMRKFIAKILWDMAAFNVRLAEKVCRTDRALFTKVKAVDRTTITLETPLPKSYQTGDKVMIIK